MNKPNDIIIGQLLLLIKSKLPEISNEYLIELCTKKAKDKDHKYKIKRRLNIELEKYGSK